MIDLIFRLLKMKRTTLLKKKISIFCSFFEKKLAKISLFFGKTRIYVVIWFGGGSVDRT